MTTIIIRVFIIYSLVLLVFRLMGKRQIAQMQPFEFVLTLIIADLATIPMAETSLPLLNGAVPLLTLVLLHFIITILTQKSSAVSKFISGKPVIVINPNGIDFEALKKLSITIDDLFESIRTAGYFSIADVHYAIMETNGKVSVMPKVASSPPTSQDLKIEKQDTSLPITIVSDGKFVEENIKLSKCKKDFYIALLKKQKIESVKNILLLTINMQGDVFLQPKNQGAKTFSVEMPWKEL